MQCVILLKIMVALFSKWYTKIPNQVISYRCLSNYVADSKFTVRRAFLNCIWMLSLLCVHEVCSRQNPGMFDCRNVFVLL